LVSTSKAFGPEELRTAASDAGIAVSRETLARLKLFASLLEDWSARHNLVSRQSLAELWRRHIWDSAQLARFIPSSARSFADLGSGAGFPGLVLAEILRDRPDFHVTLFEATAKKCQFLKTAADRLGLAVAIRNERVEAAKPEPFDIVAARACAPLVRLLPYAQRFWGAQTVGLFLKGQNLEAELTQARKSWKIKARRHPSLSDPSGVILEIQELGRAVGKNRHA